MVTEKYAKQRKQKYNGRTMLGLLEEEGHQYDSVMFLCLYFLIYPERKNRRLLAERSDNLFTLWAVCVNLSSPAFSWGEAVRARRTLWVQWNCAQKETPKL